MHIIVLLIPIFFVIFRPSPVHSQNEVFGEILGCSIDIRKSIIWDLLGKKPGTGIFSDSNKDGKRDVMYFIDTDDRHEESVQPLLVMVCDEDGDMDAMGRGDYDSDLYIADWNTDGTVDRAIDYIDLDGDDDVDEQLLYFKSDNPGWKNRLPKRISGDVYYVAWAKDYGDDNRLWYDINYEYSQLKTQWRTDFNGDEMFVYVFYYDMDEKLWIPAFENAFSFYDMDGDSCSEEVVRFQGVGRESADLRYSMDIDNDNGGSNPHDYDISVSCLGPITIPVEACRTLNLRGIPTAPVTQWEKMRSVAKEAVWKRAHLTWDENDNNIDPRHGQMHNERWEGVLNHGNAFMRQVGGPSGGVYNKRNEVDSDYSGRMQFYYSPVDRRYHLFGAEVGWIAVDYNYDDVADMLILSEDRNGNGFFDAWQFDVGADSVADRIVTIDADSADLLAFDYEILHGKYIASLDAAIAANEELMKSMKEFLARQKVSAEEDPVEIFFNRGLAEYGKDFGLGAKILNSREGRRYYQDLMRERYWQVLRNTDAASEAYFAPIEAAFNAGDFETAARLLRENMPKN